MKMRVLAAIALIPLLVAILFFAPSWVAAIAIGILCAIAAFELLCGTGLVKHTRLFCYAAVMAFCVPLWCYFGSPVLYARVGILVFTCLIFMEILISKGKLPITKAALCYLSGLLIPYMLSTLVRMLVVDSGRFVVLMTFVLAFMADTGAYFIGCAFGKHKLAPTISPKKSVEGLFGGILFDILSVLLICFVMSLLFSAKVNYLYAVVYGIVGALAGTFGDLCFSVIKRQAGIKDYGNLIPGHGGVLDRFDSVIIVAPVTELLMILLPILE